VVDQLENSTVQWYEVDLPVRGYSVSLKQVREVYLELKSISNREGERILSALTKPPDKADNEFAAYISELRLKAFNLTVSIIGSDENITKYGEDERIFENIDLPFPIKTIFFTNENSYERYADGQSPPNLFRLWIHFSKPPLFDTNPLLSEPTVNASLVRIKASDIAYFRATQSIIENKLKKHKLWYSFIHEKFSYDIGLWLVMAPYTLYTVAFYTDKALPPDGPHATFRPAFFIYGIFIGLIVYRFLAGYLKWALPVNILEDNKDIAATHRLIFGALILAILANFTSHFFGF
jgi:hypothetical protein